MYEACPMKSPFPLLLTVCLALPLLPVPRASGAEKPGEDASRKPNVLILLTDDQGRGDYSAFGTKDIRTPNIDRLFREGMTFDNFYANSCVCSPSRAALMTGCYPDRVGVPGVIREEEPNDPPATTPP
jgi:arylsulfatase A-like enzyme